LLRITTQSARDRRQDDVCCKQRIQISKSSVWRVIMGLSLEALNSVVEFWEERMKSTQAEYLGAVEEYIKARDAWMDEMEKSYGTRIAD
jgi:hypothetical protein